MRSICRDVLKRNIGRGDNATKIISLLPSFSLEITDTSHVARRSDLAFKYSNRKRRRL